MAAAANKINFANQPGRINRLAGTLLISLLLAWNGALAAEDLPGVANKVKAAMLLNFTKYVVWPPPSLPARDTPLVVGVIGKNPLVAEIEATLPGLMVERHVLIVRPFSDALEAGECHVFFIPASEKKRIPKVLERFKNRPVLTVSDAEGFLEEGGMIALRREASTIKFDINQKAAEKAGLKVSSKLLQLARPEKGKSGTAK
jgi:hypothetical protein